MQVCLRLGFTVDVPHSPGSDVVSSMPPVSRYALFRTAMGAMSTLEIDEIKKKCYLNTGIVPCKPPPCITKGPGMIRLLDRHAVLCKQ